MAELALKAVLPLTPPTSATSANASSPNAAQGSGKESSPDQQEFAKVLKARHDAARNDDKPATSASSKSAAKNESAKADDAKSEATTNATDPADVSAEALAAALALGASDMEATTEEGAVGEAAIDTEADPAATTASIDPSLLAQTLPTEPATIVANPQMPPPNLAAQTASLAGNDDAAVSDAIDINTGTASGDTPVLGAVSQTLESGPTEEFSQLLTPELRPDALTTSTESASTRQAAVQAFNAAQQFSAASAPAQPAQAPAPQVVQTPVGARGWSEEVGQRLVWSATQDNGIAEIVLTPPQLGRVEVSISMTGEQATANFVAASPAAREALQDAMPRLREILAQAGIQLGQANVSAGQSGQSQGDSQHSGRGHSGGRMSGMDGDLVTAHTGTWQRQGRGLIDTFA